MAASQFPITCPSEKARRSLVVLKQPQKSIQLESPGKNNESRGYFRHVGSCVRETWRIFWCVMLASIISLVLFLFCLQAPANSLGPREHVRLQDSPGQHPAQDSAHLQAQAEGGNATAQLRLARAYESGVGVPQDDGLAALWYRRAAEQGNSEAQDTLGAKYLVGQGLEQNKEEAVKWFRVSARQGNANAMYHLGAAYYNGDGVPIDDSFSYAWFTLAKKRATKTPQKPYTEPSGD